MRVTAIVVGLSAAVCAVGAGPGAAARASGNPCAAELPVTLAAACVAPGVTCVVKSDSHKRWEAIYGTEPTLAKAQATLARAKNHGLEAGIEVPVRCSNGVGVYEVGKPGSTTRAAAVALVAKAKAAGFSSARTEDS